MTLRVTSITTFPSATERRRRDAKRARALAVGRDGRGWRVALWLALLALAGLTALATVAVLILG